MTVVILPDSAVEPSPQSVVLADGDMIDAERAEVLAVAREIALLATEETGAATGPIVVRWRPGAEPAEMRPVTELRVPLTEARLGVDFARAVGRYLTAHGWSGGIVRPLPALKLQASRDDRTIAVAWLDQVVLIEVHGRALPMSVEDARKLLAETAPADG
ncbi:hypothetical protein [Cellulomonas sp. NPDC089187]|uniref:hypothetical protein n=1 Tax=Cellulomonas sp. NPDC089187 TaxID=3154970 RepID=UPI0034363B7A